MPCLEEVNSLGAALIAPMPPTSLRAVVSLVAFALGLAAALPQRWSKITQYVLPTARSSPDVITTGPDGYGLPNSTATRLGACRHQYEVFESVAGKLMLRGPSIVACSFFYDRARLDAK